ncbi:MAG: MFS transporter, partial [Firmicutes bacterium]|nr:MFS transporter [Bacillota bacterium]
EQQFGLDGVPKGLVLAIPVLFMSVTSFITGFVIKKKQTLMKIVVVSGLALMAVALGLLPVFRNVTLYFMLISFVGVGTGAVLPCLNTMITSAAPLKERGLVTSLYGTVRFFGVAVGPPLFGLLMGRSVNLMFWSSTAIVLIAGILAFIFIKPGKTAGQQEENTPKERGTFIYLPEPAKKPDR